jgi:RNase P/RNase MRP subunit p29
MKNQPRTGISLLVAIILTLMALAGPSLAHGGFDHVRGTVVSVNNNVLMVKTSTGNVAVKLDSRTQFTKNDGKAQLSDLVPGARVIVEVPQAKDKERVAQSVKIGAAPSTIGAGKVPRKQ